MDVLPDFTTISDDDLKALIERYAVSYTHLTLPTTERV